MVLYNLGNALSEKTSGKEINALCVSLCTPVQMEFKGNEKRKKQTTAVESVKIIKTKEATLPEVQKHDNQSNRSSQALICLQKNRKFTRITWR